MHRIPMNGLQRDLLLQYLGGLRYENIVSIQVMHDGVVAVTTTHGLETYHDAILRDGELKLDSRLTA